MNEELLCGAIFERAILDYESSKRVLADPFSERKRRDKAKRMVADVKRFAKSKEAIMYAGGSERVMNAFRNRMAEIDSEYV